MSRRPGIFIHTSKYPYLFIVILGPLYFLQQITQVSLERDVMDVRLEILVEMFVVIGVLFQHQRVGSQQIGKPVGCHRPINVQLVFVLK